VLLMTARSSAHCQQLVRMFLTIEPKL